MMKHLMRNLSEELPDNLAATLTDAVDAAPMSFAACDRLDELIGVPLCGPLDASTEGALFENFWRPVIRRIESVVATK